jgi:DNA-binding PadR family transcriptional regulator
MRRGDIRLVLLEALLEGDAHGYELIRRLEHRSAGLWRPSAGSVYPTLQLLEEEGLITGRDEAGKRVFTVTDAGRAETERIASRPMWEEPGGGRGRRDLRDAMEQLGMASRQVAMAGDNDQIDAAKAIIGEARSKLYRLLAGDIGSDAGRD